ncbi:MAG: NAD(P)H-hydrate dehydratase [Pikeienuella sp.]
MELLTAAQMRAIERAAIEAGAVTGLELMERAGRGVVEAILDWRPALAEGSQRAVVLCGPGNNGGDGFVVARLLHARGWEVGVYLYGVAPEELDRLPPDAAANARQWAALGRIRQLSKRAFDRKHHDGALYVDALFGSGLSRPLSDAAFDACRHLAHLKGELARFAAGVVAIDAPSGLCLDSGREIAKSARPHHIYAPYAQLTVTFQLPKIGHHLAQGPLHCGALVCKDIGLSAWAAPQGVVDLSSGVGGVLTPPTAGLVGLDPRGAPAWLSKTPLRHTHKYDHGHVLVLSGGVGRGGAARLAARGALRVGAGLVTVGCPPAALIENAARLDAIMLRPIDGAEALVETLADTRLNALCLGPGLGLDRARALVPIACGAARATVLDADALTAFAEDPPALFAMLHDGCVVTPHEGEFGRLFPDLLAKLRDPPIRGPAYSKVDATGEAAARAGCTVLLKGPDTVIASREGRVAIHSAQYGRAAPWLATAGSGDVLAGLIGGLLARGLAPKTAAETAAWLHVEAARAVGPGLIAEDLPEALPGVFRGLGL